MIKAVLFDLDGTVANSILDLADNTNKVLAKYGFPTHKTDDYKQLVGNGIAKMVERALPKNVRNTDIMSRVTDEFILLYKDHYCDKTEVYPDINSLLDTLKSKGLKLAVITNKAQPIAELVVKKLCGDRFDIVFGKNDGFPSKPDPMGTKYVMEKLSVLPDECLFVGDSNVDIACAVNSGALPVGVLWGYRDETELLNAGAKAIVNNPLEILNLI